MSVIEDTIVAQQRQDAPYRVSVQEYKTFREQGFLVVKGLVSQEDTAELRTHTEDILAGRVDMPGVKPLSDKISADERVANWSRIHMLHRVLPIQERFLLHPRILDVLEALIGPDLLALQSMLFFKQPGQDGQGYHQDSYYIPTFPDTLCGAWLAIDRADEENGCMWMTVGSQNEPVFPDPEGRGRALQSDLQGLETITGASNTDEAHNGLTRVARTYAGREIKAEADPGDVVFFGGHILHRSHANRTTDRMRRSFVGHYCNARSWVPWNSGAPYEGDAANYVHILARGTTHLPYAQPQFGTPCAANQPILQERTSDMPMSMMPGDDGMLGMHEHGDGDHM